MPPILWAFFIAVGLASGSALMGPPRAWDGVDPTAHSQRGKPERGFHSWLSAPPYQIAKGPTLAEERCDAVAFGVSLGQRRIRAQFDGLEQQVDWSWNFPVTAGPNERRIVTVRYLDPVGGAELACHEMHFTCVPEIGWTGEPKTTIAFGEPCAPPAGAQKGIDQTGPPRLEFVRPGRVMTTRYVPGVTYLIGVATLIAEVRGAIDERWYCPRVEWEFPLEPGMSPQSTTKSMHEEDCEPYTPALAAKQQRRYVTRVALPEGTWTITVSLWKGDEMIARQSAQVTVGNSDPNASPYGPWW